MIDKLLKKLLKIKFAGELVLKDGTVLVIDGDLAVGANVQVQSPDGLIPLPSGDYELESGEIISVEDGKIVNITEVVDTVETPDVNGAPPVGEISVEVEASETNLIDIPVEEVPVEVEPEMPEVNPMEEVYVKIDELTKRLDELESKLAMRSEVETELRTELDFIKSKTLVTELKKSKDVDDNKIVSRFDVIKNLKNNK